MDHIDAMDDLRQGIRLRAYAQTDPVIEYKREGFEMFEAMTNAIKEEIVRRVFLVRLRTNEEVKRERVAKITGEGGGGDKTVKRQPVVKKIKVGPNDPCPAAAARSTKNAAAIRTSPPNRANRHDAPRRISDRAAAFELALRLARQKPAVSPEPEAIEQPAESAPVSEAAPTFPAESEPGPFCAELEPAGYRRSCVCGGSSFPAEVTLPNEPLPLTEDGAIAVAEAVSTLPVFPRRTETSVYAASDTALYDLDEGATLPAPGGPAWNQMSEAGVQAFTWYDGEFRDEDFGHLTCDMRIWCVHLHETEDPLNNLYLYLNADTGDLLGTRRVTD